MFSDIVIIPRDELKELIRQGVREVLLEERKEYDKEPGYLSFDEACKYLNVSASTLNRYKSKDKIPYQKFGKRVLFKKKELDQSLEKSNYNKLREIQ